MTPKEYKQMMDYLTRSGVSKQVTFASDIARPDPKPEIKEIEAFNEFNKRNPQADGGRIGFDKAGIVRKGKGEFEGLFSVRAAKRGPADNIPGAVKFGPEAVYFKTEKEAKDFQKNFKRKVTMKPGATPSNDPERLKKINDFVEEFKKDFGRKPTSSLVAKTLGEQVRVIPFYEKIYGKLPTVKESGGIRISNVERDVVKILKDPKIIKKLEAGKFPSISDVSRITKLDPTLSETRLVDLAEKLKDNPKYKKLAEDYLEKPGAITDSFGGRKTKRSRNILENRFQKLMGLDQKLPSLRANIVRKIQKLIPELKGLLAVDEIAGITTSMRRGSGPYAIFGQVIGNDFNTSVKGTTIDKAKGFLEKELVNLKPNDPKRLVIQKKYNEAVTNFENKANVDNPAKKVKGLKVSYKPPSQTIKNKKIYNQYKDLFDTHYKTYGYSFEVPADRDSLVDISKKLDNKSFQGIVKNRFKNLIAKGGKVGALAGLGTLAGTGFALADVDGTEAKSILPTAAAGAAAAGTVGTKPGRKLLGKAFRTLGTRAAAVPFAGLTVAENIRKGENVADAVIDPLVGAELLFPNLFRENVAKITSNPTLQKILKVGKFGRAFTPVGAGITAAGLGIDAAKFTRDRIRELQAMTPEQREKLRAEQSAFAFEGAKDGGRMGFKVGSLRKGIQALIDKSVKSTPKDTTPDLDALIKKTLDEDFFDKKDRIIDNINAKIARARAKGLDSEEIGEGQIEFYDDITKSNFRTKTGPFFDRRKKAGGGLLKQAGDRSGAMLESMNPDSQGLPGLLKRVKKQ